MSGLTARSREPDPSAGPVPAPVRRASLVARDDVLDALQLVRSLADEVGVELTDDDTADLVVVLGGDGTMLRALKNELGTGVPAIGVNFGRVGFLTSIPAAAIADGLRRVFAGDFRVTELPTVEVELDGARHVAVNDVVATSSVLGRMVDVAWSLGDEDLGVMGCDGVVCSTPSGSTAYNLSNGGPVLVWGLDAMAVTFVSPHSLHARPLVAPRGRDLGIANATVETALTVIADGVPVGRLQPGARASVRLCTAHSLLASLPEVTFFRRYRDAFGS